LYGIEGHGKGEVDHVGGIAKVYARDEISGGVIFTDAGQIVNSLIKKFGANTTPRYQIREIYLESLNEARNVRRKKNYKTVDGSSAFHVVVFQPNQNFLKLLLGSVFVRNANRNMVRAPYSRNFN